MSVRPCPVLLKNSGMFQDKNPSSGLRFKHENIAFTNTVTSWVHDRMCIRQQAFK